MSEPLAPVAPAALEIDVLGGFAVWIDGLRVPTDAWRRPGAAWLLKLLAITPGHALEMERAATIVWPHLGRTQGLATLGMTVARLEALLGLRLTAAQGAVGLPLAVDAVDAFRFEQAAHSALGDRSSESRSRALDLYAGPLLPQDGYLEWLEEPRSRLESLHQSLMEQAH